ncbi:MAG: hypothetical protein Q9M28_12155 [Mariprofundaceae bacterium]|nr:hypothetical protein [Mariprofundaceae bacterium]
MNNMNLCCKACFILSDQGKEPAIKLGVLIGKGDEMEGVFDVLDVMNALNIEYLNLGDGDDALYSEKGAGAYEKYFIPALSCADTGKSWVMVDRPRGKDVYVRFSGLIQMIKTAPNTEKKSLPC